MTALATKATDVVAAINAGIDSYERSTGTTIQRGVRVELVAHLQAAVGRLATPSRPTAPAGGNWWKDAN